MTMRDNLSNLRNESVQECGERSRVHSCQYVLWSLLSNEVHRPLEALSRAGASEVPALQHTS